MGFSLPYTTLSSNFMLFLDPAAPDLQLGERLQPWLTSGNEGAFLILTVVERIRHKCFFSLLHHMVNLMRK